MGTRAAIALFALALFAAGCTPAGDRETQRPRANNSRSPVSLVEFELRDGPTALVGDGDDAWIALSRSDRVRFFATEQQAFVGKPLAVDATVVGIALGDDSLWATGGGDGGVPTGFVKRFDLTKRRLDTEVKFADASPYGIAYGAGGLWVTNASGAEVWRFNGETMDLLATIEVRARPTGIATANGYVWVTHPSKGFLTRIDPASNSVVGKPMKAGKCPWVEPGFGDVWVGDYCLGELLRFDGATGKLEAAIQIGGRVSDIAAGKTFVWVTDSRTGRLLRVDPRSNAVVGSPIDLDGSDSLPVERDDQATAVAVTDHGIVVANYGLSSLTLVRPGPPRKRSTVRR